jgi:hypothetical protein
MNQFVKPSELDVSSVQKFVEGLPADNLVTFMQILSKGSNMSPVELTQHFPLIMEKYSISFIGGGNAQNFKIVNKSTSEAYVLKIDYRDNVPRELENQLRKGALNSIFVPLFVEREATFDHAQVFVLDPINDTLNHRITCSLLVTSFLESKDLNSYISQAPNDQGIQNAMRYGKQMADIFLALQKNDCAFLDSKNSNWLIGDDRLQLADTKSFLPTKGGFFKIEECAEKGYTLSTSYFMIPPEIPLSRDRNKPIRVDKMHVYLLGKNLYQMITQCDDMKLRELTSDERHFKDDIFLTVRGQIFKNLIQRAIDQNPKKRITLSEARERLSAPMDSSYAPGDFSIANQIILLLKVIISFIAKLLGYKKTQEYKAQCQSSRNEANLGEKKAPATSSDESLKKNSDFKLLWQYKSELKTINEAPEEQSPRKKL